MKANYIITVCAVLLFISCSKTEITPRDYMRVKTMDVSNISKTGAVFNAEIIYPGNQEITEYGFVWIKYAVINGVEQRPSIKGSEKITLDGKISTGIFSAEVPNSLTSGTKYTVRAYAMDSQYLVYGISTYFTTLD